MKIRKNMFIVALVAIVLCLIGSWNVFAQFESDDMISAEGRKGSEEQGPPDWAPAWGRKDKDQGKGPAWKESVKFIKLYNKSGLPVSVTVSKGNKIADQFQLEPGKEYREDLVKGVSPGSKITVQIGGVERRFNFNQLIGQIDQKSLREALSNANLEIAYQPYQKAIIFVVSPKGQFIPYK